jgi:hypothetical protein
MWTNSHFCAACIGFSHDLEFKRSSQRGNHPASLVPEKASTRNSSGNRQESVDSSTADGSRAPLGKRLSIYAAPMNSKIKPTQFKSKML